MAWAEKQLKRNTFGEIVPQYFDEVLGDWVPYTGVYGEVTLSGKIVEETILVDQQEIRDTEMFFVPNLDALVDRYVSWDIKIRDTHYTVLGQGDGAGPACRWGLFVGSSTPSFGSSIIADSGRAYKWTMGDPVHSASTFTVEWPGYTNDRTNNVSYMMTNGLSLKDVLANADMKFYQHFNEQLEERFSNRQLFVDRLFSPDYRSYARGHHLVFQYLEAPIGGSITLTLVVRLR